MSRGSWCHQGARREELTDLRRPSRCACARAVDVNAEHGAATPPAGSAGRANAGALLLRGMGRLPQASAGYRRCIRVGVPETLATMGAPRDHAQMDRRLGEVAVIARLRAAESRVVQGLRGHRRGMLVLRDSTVHSPLHTPSSFVVPRQPCRMNELRSRARRQLRREVCATLRPRVRVALVARRCLESETTRTGAFRRANPIGSANHRIPAHGIRHAESFPPPPLWCSPTEPPGVIALIIRLVLSAAFLAASVFLATTAAGDHTTLRIASAVLVGLPGAHAFSKNARRLFGRPSRDTRTRVKRLLQSALIEMHRDGFDRTNIMLVSFHVWMVPAWYRTLFPFKLRRAIPIGEKIPTRLRPSLVRLAMFRFEHQPPSGLRFRKGIGLVGRCVEIEDQRALIARFDSPPFRAALASDEAWSQASIEVTHGLKRPQAERLSRSYNQAAAVAIREATGEPIGCVTLELPRDGNPHFRGQNDPLLKQLKITARQIEIVCRK